MQKQTRVQKTTQCLREQIRDGVYRPGQKLPNENELSQNLGISRTTLREAIHTLVAEGVLEVQRGNGTFVAKTLDQYADAGIAFSEMKITLKDLYEARQIFEPAAAVLACERASDAEIQEILKLGEVCQKLLKEDPKAASRIESEAAFHGAILKAAHNEFLSQFMPILTETLEKTFAMNYNLDMVAEDAYKDHIMIMEFLQKRDAQALRSAVLIHLHHAIWNERL